MLDNALRPVKDHLLGPVARASGGRVHPGVVTAAALVAGLAAAGFAWRGWYGAALAGWLVNRVLDGLDGVIARARGLASDRGGYFDLLADFLVYALIPIALAAGRPDPGAHAAVAWLLASFYVNAMSWMYIAAVLERRKHETAGRRGGTSIVFPEGIIGGTETILFYGAFLLFPTFFKPLALLMTLLTAAGAAQRAVWAWRRL